MKKKLIRWGTGSILVLGTVVTLFYAEENWRGGHRWKEVESELKAKGEPLTIEEVIPPEVPDDQNTAMAPLWQEVFTQVESRKKSGDMTAPRIQGLKISQGPWASSVKKGEALDLKVRAHDLGLVGKDATEVEALNGLASFFSGKKELAMEVSDSLRRPSKRWPLRYADGLNMALPHLGPTLDLGDFYKLRGIFSLAQGNEKQAYEDLESIWLLADCYHPELNIISSLVEITLQGMSWSVIWEGLAAHQWSPSHLEQIKKALLLQQGRSIVLTGLRGERTSFLSFVAGLSARDLLLVTTSSDAGPSSWSKYPLFTGYAYLRPQGWIDLDRALYSTTMQKGIEWQKNLMDRGVIPTSFSELEEVLSLGDLSGWQRFQMPLSTLSTSTLGGVFKKSAELMVYQRMAVIACSLEQYRLATGRIPSDLSQLVPAYLASVPLDAVNGQPIKYLPKGGEDYLLYSLGINGTDEGGKNSKDKQGGDWVWSSRSGLAEILDK